jgi:SAM-dependent methyltransferase
VRKAREMGSTLEYYDRHAERIAAHYEEVDFSATLEPVIAALPAGARVLELGCGSGRDAAALLARGFDVTATDGSAEILAEAARHHPELSHRLIHHALPGELPFEAGSFEAVLSMAVLMHLEAAELKSAYSAVHRVLRPGGLFAYSVNTERAGLDARGRDERGRHFTCLSPAEWERLHEAAGFQTEWKKESDDVTGRAGIRWVTFLCRSVGAGVGSGE